MLPNPPLIDDYPSPNILLPAKNNNPSDPAHCDCSDPAEIVLFCTWGDKQHFYHILTQV